MAMADTPRVPGIPGVPSVPSVPGVLDPYGELFAQLMALPVLAAPATPNERERLASVRRKLVWAYAWAVPSPEAVTALAALSPLIEIGAGTGYWSWLLRQAGADVLAFDQAPALPAWTEVTQGGPEQVVAYPRCTLLLCWPPMGEALAADCVEAFGGDFVCVIGETGEAARTGDARLRAGLAARFVLEREVVIPCWPGYTDRLAIYRRR